MEIIADMGGSFRMVKMTDTEIARIMGFGSTYDEKWDRNNLNVGKVIDIVAIAKESKYLRESNLSQMKSILDHVDRQRDQLIKAIDLAKEMQTFDTLKG
jgi:hypothetical protein